MELKFKEGDWIIATKPAIRQSTSFSLMGPSSFPVCAYMHRPIMVRTVTEAHIIYLTGNGGGAVIPFHELQERGFIVAAPELVETTIRS